jgi:excisionase family DNA binding protein
MTRKQNLLFQNSLADLFNKIVNDEVSAEFAKIELISICDRNKNSLGDEIGQKYVYGLSGLAKLLGCSKPTAHKIKNSGKIPFAKIGKKFIFDEQKVLDSLSFKGRESVNV